MASLWTALRTLTPLVVQVPLNDVPFLTHAVSWLVAVGLLLSATLNGFGSVSFPFTSLMPLYLKPVTAEAVAAAELELLHLQQTLESRLRQMSEPELRIQTISAVSSVRAGQNATVGSRQGRNSSFSDLRGELSHRRSILSSEIQFLESLIEDAKSDVEEMRRAQQLSMHARTPFGLVKSWLGVIMSVVLLLRLASALLSLISSANNQLVHNYGEDTSAYSKRSKISVKGTRTDLVTLFLLWISGHTSLVASEQQLNRLTHFLSLLLTAFLTVSQVQTFLRTASSVTLRLQSFYSRCHSCHKKELHRSDQSSPRGLRSNRLVSTVYSHLLAFFAGCYCLACIVMTKLLLPEDYSRSFRRALGGGDGSAARNGDDDVFWIRSYAVNATFCASSLVSALVLGSLFAIQRQNTHRYESWTPGAASKSPSELLLHAEP